MMRASAAPGRAQHVEPAAVAEIDLEAEFAGVADALDRGVDHRHVDALGQQRLHRDLAEAAKADRPALFRAFPWESTVSGGVTAAPRGSRRSAIEPAGQASVALAKNGPATMVIAASADSRLRLDAGIRWAAGGQRKNGEGEFARRRQHACRAQGCRARKSRSGGTARTRCAIFTQRMASDAPARKPKCVRDQVAINRHADRHEEQAHQQAAKRLDIGFELVAEIGFGQQHARRERRRAPWTCRPIASARPRRAR